MPYDRYLAVPDSRPMEWVNWGSPSSELLLKFLKKSKIALAIQPMYDRTTISLAVYTIAKRWMKYFFKACKLIFTLNKLFAVEKLRSFSHFDSMSPFES